MDWFGASIFKRALRRPSSIAMMGQVTQSVTKRESERLSKSRLPFSASKSIRTRMLSCKWARPSLKSDTRPLMVPAPTSWSAVVYGSGDTKVTRGGDASTSIGLLILATDTVRVLSCWSRTVASTR